MNEMSSTIREILVKSSEAYGTMDAVRYKAKREKGGGKKETVVEAKTYRQLREDSERFSAALAAFGEQGSHVAIVGDSSYAWIVSYYGTVNSGSVAVPLDANLPAAVLCELIDRSDATVLVYDKARASTAEM
ncbi:MAG: long-chain fatty acid--CoA ligase, partial [Lachnospiraceae bacterium]|nr:long-chain fatty acid--CoA ligase [Lachnospiraceae bacterium]